MLELSVATEREETIETSSGLGLFVRSWLPAGNPRGVVIVCHGFNSHSGYYLWVGEQFAKRGFAVYALDLRGHGRSDGERFYVDVMSDWVEDVAGVVALAKSRHVAVPAFLLGHSAGGVVSCLYAIAHQDELSGLVCESFAFRVPAPDFAIAALKGLSHLAPHAHVLRLKNEDFSRDPSVVAAMNNDSLIANETQPTRTIAELARADDRLKSEFPLITVPLLILHGTADRATKPSGSQAFYDAAGSKDKTLKLYDGYYHDLLNDVGKATVLEDIAQWIDGRVPEPPVSEGEARA
jgi:alpha-beta hydrolase superfamily lysophospholipase